MDQNLPFADATFDAVYAMDALCYATDQPAIYKEISRVLKPQGLLAFADWVMTDKFDADNAEHRKVRNWIEFGNGITRMPERKEVQDALKAASRSFLVFFLVCNKEREIGEGMIKLATRRKRAD